MPSGTTTPPPNPIPRVTIECDADIASPLKKHLSTYAILAKGIRVEELEDYKVFATTRCPREGNFVSDPRLPLSHLYRLYSRSSEIELSTMMTLSEYRRERYKLGIPEGSQELLPEKALPTESNFDIIGGISFEKGCYLGQELTARSHFVGVTRKRIVPIFALRPLGVHRVVPGAELVDSLTGKGVGVVMALEGDIGIALVRNITDIPRTPSEVSDDDATQGGVVLMLATDPDERFRAKIPYWWPEET